MLGILPLLKVAIVSNMEYISSITLNGDEYHILGAMQPPQTLEFRNFYCGTIRTDGKLYFQIPFNFRHEFNSVNITYFKGTVYGVNGLIKYTNSSSSNGLTDFMASAFTKSTGLYHNHVVINCTPSSPPITTINAQTPIVISIDLIRLEFN